MQANVKACKMVGRKNFTKRNVHVKIIPVPEWNRALSYSSWRDVARHGRRLRSLRGGSFFAPDYIGGGGKMVSHAELYAFVSMLITFATLIISIAKKK